MHQCTIDVMVDADCDNFGALVLNGIDSQRAALDTSSSNSDITISGGSIELDPDYSYQVSFANIETLYIVES